MPWMNPDYYDQLEPAQQQRILRTHTPLGVNPNTGDALLVPMEDRYAGMHVIGTQGYGKSKAMEGWIHSDIRQEDSAVIVKDAHGDLSDNVAASLPREALRRTFVLDMADEEFPFGANLFAQGDLTTSVARTQAVQRIKHVFDVFWPEVMQQQYAPQYLHYATRVMLDNPGTTLYDVRRFLRERAYRAQLLKSVREPQVAEFWREYDQLRPDTQESRSRPLLNRWQFLTSSPLLRNIICQPAAIDFRKVIAEKQVLLIKLPTTTMETDAAMAGMVLLGQIEAAIFAERKPVSLYVDEFQNFATPDFEKLFSQGRKFGVRLVVANQRLDQLSAKLQEAVESARTKVVFRVTPSNARKLAQLFPVVAARPKPEDIHLYPCDYLMSHTHLLRDPGVLQFTECYLLPLQGAKSSRGTVTITDPDYRAEEFISSGRGLLTGAAELTHLLIGTPQKRSPVRVPDPTPALDMLFREVMATDNPRLTISPHIVRGLANCGDFFSAVRQISWEHPALQPGFTPPKHLIRVDEDGWEVLRQPESPSEWLAHCVFFLRHTMAYLAEHPLGNVKETGTTEIASKLVRLPKRYAFVKSGDDFGPIQTLDAPEPEPGSEGRVAFIIRQSRERYCRPREDVEAAFTTDESITDEPVEEDKDIDVSISPEPELRTELPDEPAVSRWEL